MLKAGMLNRRVTVEEPVAGGDSYGQPSTSWAAFDTVWAYVVPQSGRSIAEQLIAGREASGQVQVVRIRYRLDITTAMRLSYNGRLYNITSVAPDESSRVHTDLVCTVIQG